MRRNVELEHKILTFLYKWIRPIRIGDLRTELEKENLSIPHSTLNSTIQRMQQAGYVDWEKYGPVSLTEAGMKEVAHEQRHFHLFSMFLTKTLGISHDQAQEESYKIAGVLSCRIIEQISTLLNAPEKCICSEPIPKIKECSAKGVSS
jgi:DtxR family Mn-dependent transcriptional regulator